MYSKKSLEMAIVRIIGQSQMDALGLPRAAEEAAINLFLEGEEITVIRDALLTCVLVVTLGSPKVVKKNF